VQPAHPLNPQRVAWELSPRLPERAIITSDSGSCANWYARDLKIRRGMRCALSGGLASMGAAVPYAIAAKFAHADRPVIALVGDGGMQMNNMAELITVAKCWRKWSSPRWICGVFNNEDLNQVTWEQRVMEGDPKFAASQQIPNRLWRAGEPVRICAHEFRPARSLGGGRSPARTRGRSASRQCPCRLIRKPCRAARTGARPTRSALAGGCRCAGWVNPELLHPKLGTSSSRIRA